MSRRPASERVQGIDSRLADLVLHDGRKLVAEIAGDIRHTPSLTRTIEGSSSITIPVYDPDLRLLRASLLASQWDAEIDGLWFRYVATSKAERTLTLTLEDRDVARMREVTGPKKEFREEVTRAEFIKSLFREGAPDVDFHCPQLHKKQPIEKKSQGKKAAEEAKANRGKGIGGVKHLTVKGKAATKAQLAIGERALRVAESLGAPSRVQVALIAALIDESEMGAISHNVLQAEGKPQGAPIGDVEEEVHGFLTGKDWTISGGAIGYYLDHPNAEPADIATAVQRNAAGAGVYMPWQHEAREWVETFGGEGTGSITVNEPFAFEVKPKEGYWEAAQRLAKEVNWRLFLIAGRAFYMPEPELIAAMVRLAIDPDTPDIPPANVDFDFHRNKKVAEVKLNNVPVGQWEVPPAAVVTLAGYGPASLGNGDAPVKANKKGQRMGVGSAQKAATGEGRGRYLVASIETPLTEDSDARLATITLRRPTPPLPEPAPQKATISGVARGAIGNPTVERVLGFLEREANRNPPYVWGGFSEKGYDCSGFVSKALDVGGWLSGRLTTVGLAAWGEAGPGNLVTVYVKTSGGAHEEHTIIEVAGKFFQSGGGQNTSGSGGAEEFSPSKSYLAEFNVKRHPKGF